MQSSVNITNPFANGLERKESEREREKYYIHQKGETRNKLQRKELIF